MKKYIYEDEPEKEDTPEGILVRTGKDLPGLIDTASLKGFLPGLSRKMWILG